MNASRPILIAVAALSALHGLAQDDARHRTPNQWAVLYGLHSVNTARMALEALYSGNTNQAIQILELDLDHSVCHLDSLLRQDGRTPHRPVMEDALRGLASFRALHSRPPVTMYASEAEKSLLTDGAQRAAAVLGRYAEPGLQPEVKPAPTGQKTGNAAPAAKEPAGATVDEEARHE
jgi:hypothetical protein